MKVLIAPDKFKGSLTSDEVIDAIQKGLHQAYDDIEVFAQPLADGGEGSVELISALLDLEKIEVDVLDPLFRPIKGVFFMDGTRAFIEMAKVSGLMLLQHEERNPMKTTSYGTGQLIASAVSYGCTEINLLIGGSATNDCGLGMAKALGYVIKDGEGKALNGVGKDLIEFETIVAPALSKIEGVRLNVLTDVQNTLLGPYGAAHVYASQKGASPDEILRLEEGARRLVAYMKNDFDLVKGAGAAGGLGYGAMTFLGARVVSGIDFIIDLVGIQKRLADVDLVISGEGSFDRQSLQGKVVSGLKMRCEQHQKPLIIVCGKSDEPEWSGSPIYSILSKAKSTSDAMENAASYLTTLSTELIKDFRAKH